MKVSGKYKQLLEIKTAYYLYLSFECFLEMGTLNRKENEKTPSW